MSTSIRLLLSSIIFGCFLYPSANAQVLPGYYNVRQYKAMGDGKTIDSDAINKAINAAAGAGGGTVYFPAGQYLAYTIRLKSNVTLYLDQGAVIIAASPVNGVGYDQAEPNMPYGAYQDFAHAHWRTGLICGENLHDIAITGHGMIWGKGLERVSDSGIANGSGNMAISLKLCRNVTIKDITILQGGHFGILATGVDNLDIGNIKIDTNRDGMDIDCCTNVRITDCSVNSPFDDGICLKSSFGLGYSRATENVIISNCRVSGYDEGTMLNGAFKRETEKKNYPGGTPTGRIKMGTESNGGFKNIIISNCQFEYCRGLALETVDGGIIEDININNILMRDVTSAPIFLRLGARMRGPKDVPVGKLRRVIINNVQVYNADWQSVIISGIPGHDIEDIKLNNIKIYYKGGGTAAQAARTMPEMEKDYPEPNWFGTLPAYGFFIRHVNNLQMDGIDVGFLHNDERPAFILNHVTGAALRFVQAQTIPGKPSLKLENVQKVSLHQSFNKRDKIFSNVLKKEF